MYKRSERNQEIIKMYNSGKTYQEIANQFGISRQRAYNVVYSSLYQENNGKWKEIVEKIIFPNIRQYMLDNKMSIYMLNEKVNPGTTSAVSLSRLLTIENVRVDIGTISRILEVTGMTFEEAFSKEQID